MSNIVYAKRTDKENMVMGVCAAYALIVGVFAVIRLFNQEWLLAAVDGVLVGFASYIGLHVKNTRQTVVASHALAIITLLGATVSIYIKGPGQVVWMYPSIILVFYITAPRTAIVMSAVFMAVVAFLIRDISVLSLVTTLASYVVTAYFSYMFSAQTLATNEKLRLMATEDMLTGISNRRAFFETIENIETSHIGAAAVILDIDHFKKVNDLLGYQKGDDILNDTVDIIDNQVATDDLLFRLGGAKFAVVCPNKNFDHAYQAAARIQAAFNESHLYQENGVSLSMGVAQKKANESTTEWLKQLNSAVFKAKKTGKNRIIKAINY